VFYVIHMLVRAFTVYVRPLLEHDSLTWCPFTVHDIEAVESVQRRFTKRLRGLNGLSYPERLKHVTLDSLELRRLYTDLYYCYKMLFGLVDIQVADFFEWTPHHSTRGHNFKLYKKRCTMRVRSTFLVSVLSMSGITYLPV